MPSPSSPAGRAAGCFVRTASRALAVACACLSLAALPGCDRNPATGKRQLSLVSEEQELQIGREAAAEIAQSLGVVGNPELQGYVERIGRELAQHSERPGLPWTFRVVDDPTPNAFALPGGHIFVTRGLLALMNSEAELATVLGHEIAHVTARHAVNQMSKQQLAELGLNLGVRFFPNLEQLAGVAGAGLGLLFLKYGRDAEREADELGFRYAYERNYDVREMADVFAALQRAGEIEGRAGLPGWLATHPAEPERIRAVERRIERLGQQQARPRVGQDDFLRRLDGLVYGDDPRNGYFHGGTFYHPELAFRFDVPSGWRTQNMTSAVMALSPQRDGLVQLTFTGLGPEEATRALLAQPGMRGKTTSQSINGVPAIVTRFAAAGEQGEVRGYVAFLAHGGTTYQLVTYAPAGAYATHADEFRRVVGSFAPLTERAALTMRPATLDVVRLDRSTTLVDFAARNPGQRVGQLALLNQVHDPRRPLPAGTYLKRVVPGTPAAP
jgi:predicted Zn-dependent protease